MHVEFHFRKSHTLPLILAVTLVGHLAWLLVAGIAAFTWSHALLLISAAVLYRFVYRPRANTLHKAVSEFIAGFLLWLRQQRSARVV